MSGRFETPQRILKEVFGYDSFRPGQEDIVSTLTAGRHVLAVMPTGSGKSICYQVPALAREGLAIVISPLVALMQDQVAALKLQGVAAESINSARDREDNVAIWRRVASGDVRLLYLSPERLMTARMIEAVQKLNVTLIAIDEAHCMSQWGASFRPEYELLSGLRQAFPGVPIGAFTATADAVTREDITAKLFANDVDVHVHGFDRPNIQLRVEPRREAAKQLAAMIAAYKGQSGIVYCLSRKKTEETAAALAAAGVRALAYHAGMDKARREENQNLFMTEPGVVMVATIAFGMGIDKPDVRFVVHMDLPSSPEAYYQEIGRAGRDGQPAVAQMYFGAGDIRTRRMFIDDETGADEERRRREHKRLDALIAYCEANECRRRTLLTYFGETSEPCGNCDRCLSPASLVDGSSDARLLLEVMVATGERYGASHLTDILKGTSTEKAVATGHAKLKVFGRGAALGRADWQSIIRQMVAGGFLEQDIRHGGLSIADRGRELISGQGKFGYRALEKPPKSKGRPFGGGDTPEFSDKVLAALKRKRMDLAKARGVPAYVIFSDRTLIDMAHKRPVTIDQFAGVHGIGKAKVAEFGDEFLEVLEACA
jgi:ATP-dependent DNA helicase RecQ